MKCKVMVVSWLKNTAVYYIMLRSATLEMKKALKMHVNPRIIDFYIKEVEL